MLVPRDVALGMEEGLEALGPLGVVVVVEEDEGYALGCAFLVVLCDARLLLVSPDEELHLAHVLPGRVGQRHVWNLGVHLGPLGIELHAVVVVVEVLRHLAPLGVGALVPLVLDGWRVRLEVVAVALVEAFALAPLVLALVVAPFHVLELGLVSHCHGMDFLEHGDLGEHHVEVLELGEDLYHKTSRPKMADLSGGLSGAVFLK